MIRVINIVCCVYCFFGFSQQKTIPLRVEFSTFPVQLNQLYRDSILGDFRVTKLKMYLTDLHSETAYLIDLEDTVLPNLEYNNKQLRLQLGTDSMLNVSGIHGGIYDPLHGMYWAWNSGFVNFKLEGYSSKLTTPKGKFEFHIGGYLSPNESVQFITVPIKEDATQLVLDVKLLLETYITSDKCSILMPGTEAVEFSRQLAKSFRVEYE